MRSHQPSPPHTSTPHHPHPTHPHHTIPTPHLCSIDHSTNVISPLTHTHTSPPPHQALSNTLSQLTKSQDPQSTGHTALTVTRCVCEVVEAASQAAFLVGVADPSSSVATPGIIDHTHLARHAHLISTSCQSLSGVSSKQEVFYYVLEVKVGIN